MASINSEDFAAYVGQILENYTVDVQEAVSGAVEKTAEKVLKTVKKKSPVRSGAYKRSWKIDIEKTGAFKSNSTVTIYNKKHGPLVHLLEDGHQKKGGGRVEGHPHVQPAYQEAERLLPEAVEKAIEEATGG